MDCEPGSPLSEFPSPVQANYFERLETEYVSSPALEGPAPEVGSINYPGASDHEEDSAFDFRLFSRSAKVGISGAIGNSPQRIQLRSPTPQHGDPGFLVSRRPPSYYFFGPGSEQRAHQYAQAAVSGEDILNNSKMKWVRWKFSMNNQI